MMQTFLDVTSLATAEGRPHGILRQEQQLGLFALQELAGNVGFVIYDRKHNVYRLLDRVLAELVLKLKIRVDAGRIRSGLVARWRRHRRQTIERQHGPHDCPEKPQEAGNSGSAERPRETVALASVRLPKIELGSNAVVISCGLDWETKDLKAFLTVKRNLGFRYCGACHDLIGLKSPHLMPPGYGDRFREYFGWLFEVGDLLFVPSQHVASEIARFAGGQGISTPRLRVVPHGCDGLSYLGEQNASLPATIEKGRYILAVGMLSPRKNHRLLYLCWDYLSRTAPHDIDGIKLVFAGEVGWLVSDLLTEIRLNPLTNRSILHLANVSDALLASLYRHALYTVFPPLDEGFGLPVAEALAFGKVVVASNQGAIPELFGNNCIMLNPYDIMGWAQIMRRLISDPVFLEAECRRMLAHLRLRKWRDSAKAVFDAAREI